MIAPNETSTFKQGVTERSNFLKSTKNYKNVNNIISPVLEKIKQSQDLSKIEKSNDKNGSYYRDKDNDEIFQEHGNLTKRLTKTMYYGSRISISRPSLPLTDFAVNAFTNGQLGVNNLSTLEFLDMEMASEVGRSACVSPTVLIMALVYLERLSKNNPSYLRSVKPSELFVMSLLVASKFIQEDSEEYTVFNKDWVKYLQMDLSNFNESEMKFLNAIDWNINIGPKEFNEVLERVENSLVINEVKKRKLMTYTELCSLFDFTLKWSSIWKHVYYYSIQTFSIASAIYVTTIATLVTSVILTPFFYQVSKEVLCSGNVLIINHNNENNSLNLYDLVQYSLSNKNMTDSTHDLSLDFTNPKNDIFIRTKNNDSDDIEKSFNIPDKINFQLDLTICLHCHCHLMTHWTNSTKNNFFIANKI